METFLKAYKENKNLRDLIKGATFKSKNIKDIRYYKRDLEFKITHVKQSDKFYSDVLVNVKVCGRLGTWAYDIDEDGMCDITSKYSFSSSRSRNSRIRRYVRKEIKKYLILFGVKSYCVEINKITVAESL